MNQPKFNRYGQSLFYRDAGVDIDVGNSFVDVIKLFAKQTSRDGVLADIGGFGALFELPQKYHEPVLVSSTDGIGTKLKLAIDLNRLDTIGQDLVAMSVNDILVQGAEPLFFLDYFVCGKLRIDIATTIIKGIASACKLADCALIGGETAEMPGMYSDGEYDLAGFAVGVVEKVKIIDGSMIAPGDVVLGLASSGIHSNGFSLVRKIIERVRPDLTMNLDGRLLVEALMEPTRIYVKSLLLLIQQVAVKGIAHITGGGLVKNIPRILKKTGLIIELDHRTWPLPPLFSWLQKNGGIATSEMYRVFNCGIGMVVIVSATEVQKAIGLLLDAGEQVWQIGFVRIGTTENEQAVIV